MADSGDSRPTLLVLASTYPRWSDDSEPGFVHELSRRLAGDFKVIALVPSAPGADDVADMDGVEVVRYRYAPRSLQTLVNNGGIVTNLRRAPWKWGLLPGFLLAQYLAVLRLRRRRGIDLIHAHWLIPQGVIARAAAARIPYVVTSHGTDLLGLRARPMLALKRLAASRADAVTVVSTAMYKEARRIGLRPSRMDVMPMGVDLRGLFVPDESVERSPDLVLYVGRLVAGKGLEELLEAMVIVLRGRPQTRLVIAGQGPEAERLQERSRSLGINHAVRFAGGVPQKQLPGLYRAAALLAAPFTAPQGLGLVVAEAIGCMCPVVVADIPSMHDLLSEGDGTKVPSGDASALARAMLQTLEHPEEAKINTSNAREKLLARLDWSVVATEYAKLLNSCLASPGREAGRA